MISARIIERPASVVVALAAIALLTGPARAGQYTYTTVNDPLATAGTSVLGINNAGTIVGNYINASGTHGFVDSGGVFTTINDPVDTSYTQVKSINDAGALVGQVDDEGFIYSGGVFTSIMVSGETIPLGVNSSGMVVGYSYNGVYSGFTYKNGVYTVGPSGLTFNGINNAGVIVGEYSSGNQAFVDNNGVFTNFSDPSASGPTGADGINSAGAIVGYYFNGANQHGYIYEGGQFTTLNDPSATGYTSAQGINNAGVIVGTYQGPDGYEGFIATPVVPEPAAWALMLVGAGGLGAGLRRRRWRAQVAV
jgi:hypothetical protein